jgi:hypothetical protein
MKKEIELMVDVATLEYMIKAIRSEIFLIKSAMYDIKSIDPYYLILIKSMEKYEKELNKLKEEV